MQCFKTKNLNELEQPSQSPCNLTEPEQFCEEEGAKISKSRCAEPIELYPRKLEGAIALLMYCANQMVKFTIIATKICVLGWGLQRSRWLLLQFLSFFCCSVDQWDGEDRPVHHTHSLCTETLPSTNPHLELLTVGQIRYVGLILYTHPYTLIHMHTKTSFISLYFCISSVFGPHEISGIIQPNLDKAYCNKQDAVKVYH